MIEIAVISGKGGTGKTTITSSLVPYLKNCVTADCDVDAPDLDILFKREIKNSYKFYGMDKAFINDKCTSCGECLKHCKFDAIIHSPAYSINSSRCEGCGVCSFVCPAGAAIMKENPIGRVYESYSQFGHIIHARLHPGEENSGRLVSEVKRVARKRAKLEKSDYIIADGSPGIACSVISSISGAGKVIIVTEPTISGLHDLERVYKLASGFRNKIYLVINKYDLSLDMSSRIEEFSKSTRIETVLKIPFSRPVVDAISNREIPSVREKELFSEAGFFEFIKRLEE